MTTKQKQKLKEILDFIELFETAARVEKILHKSDITNIDKCKLLISLDELDLMMENSTALNNYKKKYDPEDI